MHLHRIIAILAAAVAALPLIPKAGETPFTPYKDGYATSSTYTGNSRTLIIRSPDSKGWISHALVDGSGQGLISARLQIYVKDVVKDGDLKVMLATSLNTLENQTRFTDLKAKDSVGGVSLKAVDHIQSMVEIKLSPAFLKSVGDGSYAGLVLESANGLDAEVGALEGSHGAILYLGYASTAAVADSTLINPLASRLATAYKEALRGATGATGASGGKGDSGARGPQGLPGAAGGQGIQGPKGDSGIQGPKGDRGTTGLSGDQSLTFNLLQDRGARAYYPFNKFSADFKSTPDSSGQGNPLSFSSLGINIKERAPGDSVVDFLGNGYAYAGNSESLDPYREITLSAKVNLALPAAASPDTETVFSKKNQYELAIIDNILKFRLYAAMGNSGWVGAGDVPNGTWAVVQASYDGKAIRLFVNGKQTFFKSFMGGPMALDSANLYLGARDVNVRLMKGSLDSIKILSYCIPAQDAPTDVLAMATRAQLSIDSVPGLRGKLDSAAPLNAPHFTGRVGIGTSSPSATLQVLPEAGSSLGLKVGARNAMYLYANPPILGFASYFNSVWRHDANGYAGFLQFDTSNGSLYYNATPTAGTADAPAALTTRMAITNTGRVGFGILNPGGALEVKATDFNALRLTTSNPNSDVYITGVATSEGGLRLNATGGHNFLAINTKGTEVVTVDSNGLMNAKVAMDVGNARNANGYGGGLNVHDRDGGDYTNIQLAETYWGGSHALAFNAYKTASMVNGGFDTPGNMRYSNSASTYGSGAGMIQFTGNGGFMDFLISPSSSGKDQPISWTDVLHLQRNGNVGIGTSTPGNLLTVDGGAARKGITITSDGDASAYNDLEFTVDTPGPIASGKPSEWILSLRKDGYFSGDNSGPTLEFYAPRKATGGYYAPLAFKSNGDVVLASSTNAVAGKVGIGTTAPTSTLTIGKTTATSVEANGIVLGSDENSIELVHSTSPNGYGSKIFGVDEGASVTSLRIATRNNSTIWTNRVYLSTATGNLAIGTITDNGSAKLQVAGNVTYSGTLNGASDRRFKKKIQSITNALAKIDSLRGVTYEWDTDAYPDRGFEPGTQLGFIAQEVESIVPELVHTDVQGFKSLDYSKVTPLLVEAVKTQERDMHELRDQMSALKALVCLEHAENSFCQTSK